MSTAIQNRNTRAAFKRRITTALQEAGFTRATETTSGFHYTDEYGKHSFVPRDRDDLDRIGLNLGYAARDLTRRGRYDEGKVESQIKNYEMAAALVRAGFKLTVEQNHANDSGFVVLWADENEGR